MSAAKAKTTKSAKKARYTTTIKKSGVAKLPKTPLKKTVYLLASGDLRPSANQKCWAAQEAMEAALTRAVKELGYTVIRAHAYKPSEQHGFISSQKEGIEVFANMNPKIPVIVAESVWQYSNHVFPGLLTHEGPILTVANWSGTWPGLVGMLNLNACLSKAGKPFSTLWSADFTDKWFLERLEKWLKTGVVRHTTSQVSPLKRLAVPVKDRQLGEKLAAEFRAKKSILGIFDEGCMGMYNAIIPDELLFPIGVFKERLSQSALYYATTQVSDEEARDVYRWMMAKGMVFQLGEDPETELTLQQVLWQCKMYIAAVRMADEFGCAAIGIQYQQGLKDLLPAGDLAEGMLNNADRPPVRVADGGRVLFEGKPVVHFNEVDEPAGLDALLNNRVAAALGQPLETTLHDVRWGDFDPTGSVKEFVWAFQISGAVPPAHLEGGWKGAESVRQSPTYFRLGGGTLRGICKPGEIVWSRIFVERGRLCLDIGRGRSVRLPYEEVRRRLHTCSQEWPIMNAVLNGVSRDQFMARHRSNHIQVIYANSAKEADRLLAVKAAMAAALGIEVSLCGIVH